MVACKMNIRNIIITVSVFSAGCTHKAQSHSSLTLKNSDIEVVRVTNGFKLNYTNRLTQNVCIDKGDWPDKAGKVHYAKEIYTVKSEQDMFPIQDRNLGYSTNNCFYEIIPGKKISAFIPDSEFNQNDNKYIYRKNDALSINLVGHHCQDS